VDDVFGTHTVSYGRLRPAALEPTPAPAARQARPDQRIPESRIEAHVKASGRVLTPHTRLIPNATSAWANSLICSIWRYVAFVHGYALADMSIRDLAGLAVAPPATRLRLSPPNCRLPRRWLREQGGGLVQAVMVSVWCPAVVGIVTSVPRLVWRI
jgi:hypothetical protein